MRLRIAAGIHKTAPYNKELFNSADVEKPWPRHILFPNFYKDLLTYNPCECRRFRGREEEYTLRPCRAFRLQPSVPLFPGTLLPPCYQNTLSGPPLDTVLRLTLASCTFSLYPIWYKIKIIFFLAFTNSHTQQNKLFSQTKTVLFLRGILASAIKIIFLPNFISVILKQFLIILNIGKIR
jgi:hypothetical protein